MAFRPDRVWFNIKGAYDLIQCTLVVVCTTIYIFSIHSWGKDPEVSPLDPPSGVEPMTYYTKLPGTHWVGGFNHKTNLPSIKKDGSLVYIVQCILIHDSNLHDHWVMDVTKNVSWPVPPCGDAEMRDNHHDPLLIKSDSLILTPPVVSIRPDWSTWDWNWPQQNDAVF